MGCVFVCDDPASMTMEAPEQPAALPMSAQSSTDDP